MNYEVIVIKKKNLQKPSLVVHAFVSAKGMYVNLLPTKDKGGRWGEGSLLKNKGDKLLLSLRPESSSGYLLHCIHLPLVNEVTDKMCKRTRRLTSHG